MSSISSAGAGAGLFQYFKSIGAAGSSDASTNAAATDSTAATGSPFTVTSDAQTSGQHVQGHHRHGKGGGQFFKKLQDAVSSALQQAKSSGDSADPNQVVQDAIAKVLKEQGGPAAPGQSPAAGAPVDSDGDHDGSTHAVGSSQSASAQSAFAQTLQSFGIDASQFHSDFLAAIKDAKGGNVDPSTAFQSFPPGAQVDTTA